MLSKVDSDGYCLMLMEGIVDYRKDESVAINMEEKYIITKTGQLWLMKTTARWDLLGQWKDNTESWTKLSVMKESHPVETAEFVRARGISDRAAFCWWVPSTLKKRDAIISAVNMRVRKMTHKYGIEILTGVEHTKGLDRQNNNTMWMDTLAKEMYNVGAAFEVLDEGQKAPNGWKKVTGHLVWDVKMDLMRKARWVFDGAQDA